MKTNYKRFFFLLLFFSAFNGFSEDFSLYSDAFKNGGKIPVGYANYGVNGGENISPVLKWKNVPDGVKSFALSCIDISANDWVHWFAYNIPPTTRVLSERASVNMPEGTVQLLNSFGTLGYGGPQPPPGSGIHKYVFVIYALRDGDFTINKSFMNSKEIEASLKSYIIAKAIYIGTFER